MSIDISDVLEFLKDEKNLKQIGELMKASPKKTKGCPKKIKQEEGVVDLTQQPEVVEDSDNVEVVDLTKKSGGKGKKGQMCRRVSLNTSRRKNNFKDNTNDYREDYENFDRKAINHNLAKNKKKRKAIRYKVKCRECKETFIIDEPPISFESGPDGAMLYCCDSCIPGR